MSADTEAARLRALCDSAIRTLEGHAAEGNHMAGMAAHELRKRFAAIPEAGEGGELAALYAQYESLERASFKTSGENASLRAEVDRLTALPFSPAAAKAASDALGWEWEVGTGDDVWARMEGGDRVGGWVRGEAVVFPPWHHRMTREFLLALLHGVHLVEKGR